MLNQDEHAALDQLRAHYPDAHAASVSVLRWLQRRRGWLSDETMNDAAEYLGMPLADLESLATFYNLLFRKPVGEQVILLCDSVSCWMRGYERIRARLERRLQITFGETTPDGRYTLLPVVCLGDCDHAPVMMVGDDLHGDLTPARIDEILTRHSDGRQKADDDANDRPAGGPSGADGGGSSG